MAPSSSTLSFFDREIRNLLTADDDYTLPVDTIYKKARADYEKQPWLTSDGLALGVHCFSALFTSILLGPVLILFFLSLSEFLFKGGVPLRDTFNWRLLTTVLEIPTNVAIRLIYLPYIKWKCHGGVLSYLLSSKSRVFKEKRSHYIEMGRKLAIPIEQERDNVKTLRDQAIRLRRIEHQNAVEKLQSGPSAEVLDAILKKSSTRDQQIRALTALYDSLTRDIDNIKDIAKTQATQESAGYEGLSAWAKDVRAAHETLIQATITISFVGASITYTTIFSASRGDIGLMCWSYALFNIGFIFPVICHGLLSWAARVDRAIPFNAAVKWRIVLSSVTYISVIAVIVAIYLLNFTILKLTFPIDPTTGQRGDSDLMFGVQPGPSSIMMFVLAATGVLGVLGYMAFYVLANGWKGVMRALKNGKTESGRLDSYVLH